MRITCRSLTGVNRLRTLESAPAKLLSSWVWKYDLQCPACHLWAELFQVNVNGGVWNQQGARVKLLRLRLCLLLAMWWDGKLLEVWNFAPWRWWRCGEGECALTQRRKGEIDRQQLFPYFFSSFRCSFVDFKALMPLGAFQWTWNFSN